MLNLNVLGLCLEFNLATTTRERKSAPPLKPPTLKAREMPNFNKIAFKPAKNSRDLTVPQGFELASLRRHEVARQQIEAKLQLEDEYDQQLRQFKSRAVPDYEAQELMVMPSDKPITVPVKPSFASDALPKKEVIKIATPKQSDSPRDFVF